MGAWQSNLTQQAPAQTNDPAPGQSTEQSTRPSSPPHPSRSTFIRTPIRPQPRTALSYFLPNPIPELQQSHSTPTLRDTRQTIDILSTKLPTELVSRILDEANYWAGSRVLLKKELDIVAASPHSRHRLPRQIGWRNGQEEGVWLEENLGEVWYILSNAVGTEDDEGIEEAGTSVPEDENTSDGADVEQREEEEEEEEGCWLREIVIETLSKDQGWSSAVTANPALYGTYDSTYSWFEISILRNGAEVEGTRRSIQNNVHAGQYFKSHRIVLGSEDDFVRKCRKGDRVILWVRAQYPGWQNLVREAAITLYCAPFPLT